MSSRVLTNDPIDSHPAPLTCGPSRSSLLIALTAVAGIAVADLFLPGFTMPVLYAAPLILLGRSGWARRLWPIAVVLVVLTYGAYFGKNAIRATAQSSTAASASTGQSAAQPTASTTVFDFRLVNRTFAAVMLLGLTWLLRLRLSSQSLQGELELPEGFTGEEDETDETVALLAAGTLLAIIGVVDMISPSKYNLAILYVMPLFLCAWIRKRQYLWTMLVVSLVLTVLGYVIGPQSQNIKMLAGIPVGRALAAIMLLIVAAFLHFQLGAQDNSPRVSNGISGRSRSSG